MKKITMNSFGKGLNMDLNPLSTPKDVLTDCLNGTIITYNGDEFNLQTELGNVKVQVTGSDTEDVDAMPAGFIPLGVKEFNGIMYIVAHNPFTKETRIGSLPSPQRYVVVSDGDNQTTKSIVQIEDETQTLKQSTSLNHGMNLLTSFLSEGDKFQLSITLGNVTDWEDADNILRKFVNNYDPTANGGEGYFDFKYYLMDIDGNLTPIDVSLTPNIQLSDINYSPIPSSTINGKKKVSSASKAVITLIITPSDIKAFDFKLSGDNTDEILKAKVTFSKDDGKTIENNSAIKIQTVKIRSTSSDGSITLDKYFDYNDFRNSSDSIREVLLEKNNPSAESFPLDTLITVTCTPIDQFGRELTNYVKTHTYTITNLPVGVDAHNYYRYELDNSLLTLHYNFLYKGPGLSINTTSIEFYDFWSNVSVLYSDIALPLDRTATVAIPMASFPKTNVFVMGGEQGGIPGSSITTYSGTQSLLSGNRVMSTLRKDHCYIVRIFGEESGKTYNIFQLLYTLPIPIFTNNNLDNYGTIDIVSGLLLSNGQYDLGYEGSGIITTSVTPINISPTPTILGGDTSNYTPANGHPAFTTNEAYRIYGGPVFNEAYKSSTTLLLKTAEWGSKKYYRNAYSREFFDTNDANVKDLGYHNFSEISYKLGLTPNGLTNPNLFGNSNPYIVGGLTESGSHKDFKFSLSKNYVVNPPTQTGTIKIIPFNSDNEPVLFGEIDHSMFSKNMKLRNYVDSNAASSFDKEFSFTSSDIQSDYTWAMTAPVIPSIKSAVVTAKLLSTPEIDTVSLYNIALHSQRSVVAPSLFSTYERTFMHNKSFKYFTWFHTQTIKSTRKTIENPSDLSTYITYALDAGIDSSASNFNLVLDSPTNPVLNTFRVLAQLSVDIKVSLERVDIANPSIVDHAISTPGYLIEDIPYGYRGQIARDQVSPTTNLYMIGCFTANPNNTLDQTIFQSYKTPSPVYVSLRIGGDSFLYDYNNLWLSDGNLYPYVGLKTMVDTDYLNNLFVLQPYRETLVAQYPDNTKINYVVSGSDKLALLKNTVTYTLNSTIIDNSLKYLTKSCFGTAVKSAFTVEKIRTIISNWIAANSASIKVLYDFTDENKSTGLAKNIPWNFTNRQTTTAMLSDINIFLTQESPSLQSIFTNAKANLDASYYLTSDPALTPKIKARSVQDLVSVNSLYFSLHPVTAENNINGIALKYPKLSLDHLKGRIITSPHVYGINKKCVDQPTIQEIIDGRTFHIGDKFGGGIIFYILKPGDFGYDPLIPHGLISSLEDQSGGIFWTSLECSQVSPGAYNYYIGSGKANTDIIYANPCARDYAVQVCTSYVVGDYDDWYMPSIDELFEMRKQQTVIGGFSPMRYWSSSEPDDSAGDWKVAWSLLFSNDDPVATYDKNRTFRVRAIRAF